MDDVFEILSRTSLKGLSLCRAVSREWNAITYESYFLRTFCERTNSKIGYIVPASYNWFMRETTGHYQLINLFQKSQGGRSTPLDFNFINPRMRRRAGDHFSFVQSGMKVEAVAFPGLVLCSRNVYVKRASGSQYFVCKPSTKQWLRIPNPRTKFFTQIIAMSVVSHSDPLFFKILRFSKPKINQSVVRFKSKLFCKTNCEVFDSRTWSWKRLKDIMLPFNVFLINGEQGVQACGVLHWIASNKKVFAFDMITEDWTIFELPDSICFKHIESYQLVNYKGRLAILVFKDKESCLVELWVLKDYVKNKVWTKEKTLNCETVKKIDDRVRPVAMYSSDAVVWTSWSNSILHNFEYDTTDVVKNISTIYGRRDMILFQTDMESWGLCEVRKPFPESNSIRAASTRRRIMSLIGIDNYISWSQTLIILLLTMLFSVANCFYD